MLENEEEASYKKADRNVQNLPNKIDSFIQYINITYLDDSLDTSTKDFFRKEIDQKQDPMPHCLRIYNGDDSRGTAPISRRPFI